MCLADDIMVICGLQKETGNKCDNMGEDYSDAKQNLFLYIEQTKTKVIGSRKKKFVFQ